SAWKIKEMTRNFTFAALRMLIFCAPLIASAEERPARGWFGGATVNSNTHDLSVAYLNSRVWIVANPAETSANNPSMGFSLYGGWRFARYVALDAGYVDFGKAHYHLGTRFSSCAPLCTPPAGYAPSDYQLHTTIVRAIATVSLPLGPKWRLDGRLGIGQE